jgi:SAM-dependent methyltransferase
MDMDEASVLQANKDHFDHAAQTKSYDEQPFVAQVCRDIAQAIRNESPFDKQTTTLLDYACGTGQISRNLAPFTRQIVGIDLSQSMVDFYNQWASNQDISPDQMRAILLGDEERELGDQKFDVIVVRACIIALLHYCIIALSSPVSPLFRIHLQHLQRLIALHCLYRLLHSTLPHSTGKLRNHHDFSYHSFHSLGYATATDVDLHVHANVNAKRTPKPKPKPKTQITDTRLNSSIFKFSIEIGIQPKINTVN